MVKYARFKIERLVLNFNSLQQVLDNPQYYKYTLDEARTMRKNLESIRNALRIRILELKSLIGEA